jgi:hypothetical protein
MGSVPESSIVLVVVRRPRRLDADADVGQELEDEHDAAEGRLVGGSVPAQNNERGRLSTDFHSAATDRMPAFHLVRVGAMGHLGPFDSAESLRYPRGARVVVRTGRGLESGEVLGPAGQWSAGTPDGTILRRMGVEDELLAERLARHRDRAFEACRARLAERGLEETLVDVEQLFDGETIVFYFLGQATDDQPELTSLTAELAALYEAKVQFRRFAETLTQGCGPGCGTEAAVGCGSACSSCVVAGGCATRLAAAGRA